MTSVKETGGLVSWLSQPIVSDNSLSSRSRAASDVVHSPIKVAELDQQIDASQVVKDDRTTTVVEWSYAENLILKRYNARNSWHRFSRSVRRSRASRCWKMSYAFAHADLNVARPIMMMEKRFGPLRSKAYFASELLQGEELLTLLPKLTDLERVKVVEAINDAFTKMESSLLSHGDMKASNLIWWNDQLFFIDLDAAYQHFSRSSWIKNHQKDRRRFLRNWEDSPELLSLFSHLEESS